MGGKPRPDLVPKISAGEIKSGDIIQGEIGPACLAIAQTRSGVWYILLEDGMTRLHGFDEDREVWLHGNIFDQWPKSIPSPLDRFFK